MRKLLTFLAVMSCSSSAAGHDFWIQPQHFWATAGSVLPATLQVGHGQFRQRSPIPAERITVLQSKGPDGVVDQKSGLDLGGAGADLRLRFSREGTYVVTLETNHANSNLPAIRFNDYLKAEGLTAAIAWREKTDALDMPGREIYSRRAKVLVQIGASQVGAQQATVIEPVGLSLEIVPDRNPYLLKDAEPLPVHVLYEGQPLSGALVKLTDLDADERPVETHVTDEAGRATFTVPHRGSWLLNVIWSKPILANRTADFVTTFSSLSFGFTGAAQ